MITTTSAPRIVSASEPLPETVVISQVTTAAPITAP